MLFETSHLILKLPPALKSGLYKTKQNRTHPHQFKGVFFLVFFGPYSAAYGGSQARVKSEL